MIPCTVTQKQIAALNQELHHLHVDLKEFPYVSCSTAVLTINCNDTTGKFRLPSYSVNLLCYGYIRDNLSSKIDPTSIAKIVEPFLSEDPSFTITFHAENKYYRHTHNATKMFVFDIFNRITMIKSIYKQQKDHHINCNSVFPLLSIILDKSKCKDKLFKKGGFSINFGVFTFGKDDKNDDQVENTLSSNWNGSERMIELFVDLKKYQSQQYNDYIKNKSSHERLSRYFRLFDCDDVALLDHYTVNKAQDVVETVIKVPNKDFSKNYAISIGIDCRHDKKAKQSKQKNTCPYIYNYTTSLSKTYISQSSGAVKKIEHKTSKIIVVIQ